MKLKSKLDNNPGLHTLEYVEQKFEEKLENLKDMIETTIKKECKSISERSYANIAKTSTSNEADPKYIKEAIKDAWREEEAEENDKLKRAQNVIVHGVTEKGADEDKTWVSDLIKDIHVKVNTKRVIRLGKAADDKKRPLLISLKDENERSKFLGNLTGIKSIEKYKGISVTEDLTPEERKHLKDLSLEAKQRNLLQKSSTEVWRVRGSSKNGFYLKKIKITKEQ